THQHENMSILNNLSNDVIENTHTHSNLNTLNNLTSSVISNSHTDSNMSTLNNLTSSVINNSHSHSNKSYLDSINQNLSKTSDVQFNRVKLRSSDDHSISYASLYIGSTLVYQLRLIGSDAPEYEYSRACFGYYNNNSASGTFNSKLGRYGAEDYQKDLQNYLNQIFNQLQMK